MIDWVQEHSEALCGVLSLSGWLRRAFEKEGLKARYLSVSILLSCVSLLERTPGACQNVMTLCF